VEISPDIGKNDFFFFFVETWKSGEIVWNLLFVGKIFGEIQKKTRKKEESACFLSYFRNNF
jgi:hypothetical protein